MWGIATLRKRKHALKHISINNQKFTKGFMRNKVLRCEGVARYRYSGDGKHGGNARYGMRLSPSSDKSNLPLSPQSYRYVIAFAR